MSFDKEILMSLSPYTYIVDRIIKSVSNELENACKNNRKSFHWFSPDVFLQLTNRNILLCLKSLKQLDDTSSYTHLIIQILNHLDKYQLKNENEEHFKYLEILFHFVSYFSHIPNDKSAELIFAKVVTHQFFLKNEILYKSCIIPFYKSVAHHINFHSQVLFNLHSQFNSNFPQLVKILIISTTTAESLLQVLDKIEPISAKYEEKNLSIIFLGFARVFATFAIEHQSEMLKVLEKADKQKVFETFKLLYDKFRKTEIAHCILSFLLMIVLYNNTEIEDQSMITHFFQSFKNAEKSKSIVSLIFGMYNVLLLDHITGHDKYQSYNEHIEKFKINFLRIISNKLLFEKFHLFLHYFGSLEYFINTSPSLIQIESLFVRISSLILQFYDSSSFISKNKSVLKNTILTLLSNTINSQYEETINSSNHENDLERAISLFTNEVDLDFSIISNELNEIHDIMTVTKEMKLFFDIFENLPNILNFIALFLKVAKACPEKLGPKLIQFVRNLFIPWDTYFSLMEKMKDKEIASFLYNICQNFLSVFTSINTAHISSLDYLQVIAQEFMNFSYIVLRESLKKYQPNIFQPFIQSLTDLLLVFRTVCIKASEEWMERVKNIYEKLNILVYGQKTEISPSENAWKELVKIPFRWHKVSPKIFASVMNKLTFEASYIDEFRIKYTANIFSEEIANDKYLESASNVAVTFGLSLLKAIREEMNNVLSNLYGKYLQRVMNIVKVCNAIVSNPEIAANPICGEICMQFFEIAMTEGISSSEFENLSMNVFKFIEKISNCISFQIRYNIILLLTDLLAYELHKSANHIILKNAVKSYSFLLKDFKFYQKIEHASVFHEYMLAREDIAYILRCLKRTALEFVKNEINPEYIISSLTSLVCNNYMLCIDFFNKLVEIKAIDPITVPVISAITKDLVMNSSPKIGDDYINNEFFSFKFTDVVNEKNAFPEYHSAAVDYAWFYGKHKDLLQFVMKNGSEKVKNQFFTAYFQRCGADIDFNDLINAYEKGSIIDWSDKIKLNEEFEYFFSIYDEDVNRLSLFQTFFVLSFFSDPYRYGVIKEFNSSKVIDFVNSIAKSLIFSRKFENELILHRPLLNQPNIHDVHERALEYLPEKKVLEDNCKYIDRFKNLSVEVIAKMRKCNIITQIPGEPRAKLVRLERLNPEDLKYFGDFFIGHFHLSAKSFVVVDIYGAKITDFEEFHRQIVYIFKEMGEMFENVYLLNLTKNASGFLNNYRDEEWTAVISVMNEPKSIFEIFPQLILPINSLRFNFNFTTVTVQSGLQANISFSRRAIDITAPGDVLTVPNATRVLSIPLELITKIEICENNLDIQYSADLHARFTSQSPQGVSKVIQIK